MTHLSGWCPPIPHPYGHQTCQERQDAGLLDPCGCTAYGGHRVNAPGSVHGPDGVCTCCPRATEKPEDAA